MSVLLFVTWHFLSPLGESHRQAAWKSHAGQIGTRLGSRRPRLNPSQLPFQCLPSSLFCLSFTLISPASISVLISLELAAFCLAQPFARCHFAFPLGKGIRRPTTTPQTQPATAMAAQKRITKVCRAYILLSESILTVFRSWASLLPPLPLESPSVSLTRPISSNGMSLWTVPQALLTP